MAYGIKTLNAIENPYNINTSHHNECARSQSSPLFIDYTELNHSKSCCLTWQRASTDGNSTHRAISKFKIVFYQTDSFWTWNSYFWRLSQNSRPAFKTVSLPTFTFCENKRTRKLDCQVRHRTSILENCLIKRGCKLWNSYHAKHPDTTSKYN